MNHRRVYCWMCGVVFAVRDGEKCPECGRTDHRVHEGDTCGCFAHINAEGGSPCTLAIGHAGEHSTRQR